MRTSGTSRSLPTPSDAQTRANAACPPPPSLVDLPRFPRPSPYTLVALIAPLPRVLRPKTPQTAATPTAQLPPHPIPSTFSTAPAPRPSQRPPAKKNLLFRVRARRGELFSSFFFFFSWCGSKSPPRRPSVCGAAGGAGGAPLPPPPSGPKSAPRSAPRAAAMTPPRTQWRRRQRAGIAAKGAPNNAPQRRPPTARAHAREQGPRRHTKTRRGPNPRPAAMYPGIGTSGTNRPSAKGSYT